MPILLYCVFVVHSLAYGLRPIKDYLTLETNPNFLISIYVYPQTIIITKFTKHWNTYRHKQVLGLLVLLLSNTISITIAISIIISHTHNHNE